MSSNKLRPMKPCTYDQWKPKFPCIVQAKIDGIRCMVRDGKPLSASGKVLPNRDLQKIVARIPQILEGCDGELVCGTLGETVSLIMSHRKPIQNLKYILYDHFSIPSGWYVQRWLALRELVNKYKAAGLPMRIENVYGFSDVRSKEEVEEIEQDMLARGFEGIIIRDPLSPYKFGKSTGREGYLVKLKRYVKDTTTVVGFEELIHQDGTPGDRLGALICKWGDTTFNVGTGFTEAQRCRLWALDQYLIGRQVHFRYLPYGMKDKPRNPVFIKFKQEGAMIEL